MAAVGTVFLTQKIKFSLEMAALISCSTFSLLYSDFKADTAENPASHRYEVGNGSRRPMALFPIKGCVFATPIQTESRSPELPNSRRSPELVLMSRNSCFSVNEKDAGAFDWNVFLSKSNVKESGQLKYLRQRHVTCIKWIKWGVAIKLEHICHDSSIFFLGPPPIGSRNPWGSRTLIWEPLGYVF